MSISSGFVATNSTALVHTSQTREVTQKTCERDPIIPLRPIVEEVSVPFGTRDDFSSPIIGKEPSVSTLI